MLLRWRILRLCSSAIILASRSCSRQGRGRAPPTTPREGVAWRWFLNSCARRDDSNSCQAVTEGTEGRASFPLRPSVGSELSVDGAVASNDGSPAHNGP